MLARYFNIQGQMIEEPLNQRLIGLDLESLRGVEHVVAVAGGIGKQRGVVGAIRTGLITDLFIDEELGLAVLRELEAGN
jgi:DNA-binding transcriptional regulator LsrR (DeoR family)